MSSVQEPAHKLPPIKEPGFRRYLIGFSAVSAFLIAGLLGTNCALDPYADFYFLTGWRMPRIYTLDTLTDVKFKVRLVRAAGRNGVGTAVFGSSRVMRIDPSGAEFKAMGANGLNLGIQGASLGQIIQFVDLVMADNPDCRPLVGLDFYAFEARPSGRSMYLDRVHPWPARGDAMGRLLSKETFATSLAMLRGKRESNDLLPNGQATKPSPNPVKLQAALEDFASRWWRSQPLFRNYTYNPERLEQLRELRARYPKAVFFVNPVSQWYRQGQEQAGLGPVYARWIGDLTSVGGVIDFSDATAITGNAAYYLDAHHYNATAGTLMMQDIAANIEKRPMIYGRVLGAQ